MPTYEYSCSTCGSAHEIVQKMSDSTLTVCPDCGEATLRKLFNNVGVMFKGSGFYRNDSRSSSDTSAAPKTTSSESTPSTPASAPAKSAPAASSSSSSSSD
ncbi:MAG: zinc ribbon domain-containing protein [Actinomycetota bacterium]|nr:zinc ribbon domain-containing protein [Actinomycetota bacterium]